MQPISGNIPVYANCFDRLTTNGIIAEDLMGYVTGNPSPYLQNYVAQRGGNPSMLGQILPDTLTPAINGSPRPAQMTQPLQQGDVYNVVPKNIGPEILQPKNKKKTDLIKQIAAGVLLTTLATIGIVKGKSILKSTKTAFQNMFKSSPTSKTTFSTFITNAKNTIVNGFNKMRNSIKNAWNKIFHKGTTP